MKKNQIICIVISIILLITFIFLTPITTFFKFSIIVSIVESLICAGIVLFGLLNIESVYDLVNSSEKKESYKLNTFLIPLGVFILSFILIYNFINYRIDSKLENEGIFTEATITNGIQTTTKSLKRGSIERSNITLFYRDTISKREYSTSIIIDTKTFDKLYKGQTLEVLYLPSNPNILKIMLEDKDIKKYKKIPHRDIQLDDIEVLMDLNNEEKILEHLLSISSGWNKMKDDNDFTLYSNTLKNELIVFLEEGKIFFDNNKLDGLIIEDIIDKQKVPIDEDEEEGTFKILIETKKFNILKVTSSSYLGYGGISELEQYYLIEKKP